MENPINMPDMQFIYDIMDEEIKKLDPSAVLEDETMEPLDLPQGFEDQGAIVVDGISKVGGAAIEKAAKKGKKAYASLNKKMK